MPVDQEKLAKLAASVRTGGKGSVRRKKKAVHKTATTGADRTQVACPAMLERVSLFDVSWHGSFALYVGGL